jgi:hypothetical protein
MLEGELMPVLERELELLGCDELDGRDLALQRLLLWRVLRFQELGFDLHTAIELADSAADLGQARRLIATGCPRELAQSIVG